MVATPTPPTKKAVYPARVYPLSVPWSQSFDDDDDAVLCCLVMRGFALIHLGLSVQLSDCCGVVIHIERVLVRISNDERVFVSIVLCHTSRGDCTCIAISRGCICC